MLQHPLPPAPPALIATASDRDTFPGNRCAPRPDGKGQRCTAQTRQYWLQLDNAATLERQVIDAEITAGLVDGMGEVKRLQILVAAAMPGWTITGLQLANAPDVEF